MNQKEQELLPCPFNCGKPVDRVPYGVQHISWKCPAHGTHFWEVWQRRAPQQSAVPEGWKLVPVRATEEMFFAADKIASDNMNERSYIQNYGRAATVEDIYDAILAAAPTPKVKP